MPVVAARTPAPPMAGPEIWNQLWIALGWVVAGTIYYPWRVCEWLIGRSLGGPATSHHVILGTLRRIRRSWPVEVSWPNMLDPHARLTVRLDLCQNTQLWYFRTAGRYNEPWMRILAATMSFVDCFIDVGAHHGLYALTISQAFPEKRVLAIEPDPNHVAALQIHQRLNGLDRIEVYPMAIAQDKEEATLYRNPLNDGGAGLQPVEEFTSGPWRVAAPAFLRAHPEFLATTQVACQRLDQLVTASCALKIDVEGSELNVLQSAEGLLENGMVPLMVVEVMQDHLDDVIQYLATYQIDCFRAGYPQPLVPGVQLGRRVANLVCLHREFGDREQVVGHLR